MRFRQGDVVTLKGVKVPTSSVILKGEAPTMYMFVVLEVMGDDLVKVCNLNGYDGRIFPIKALKRTLITSKGRR